MQAPMITSAVCLLQALPVGRALQEEGCLEAVCLILSVSSAVPYYFN